MEIASQDAVTLHLYKHVIYLYIKKYCFIIKSRYNNLTYEIGPDLTINIAGHFAEGASIFRDFLWTSFMDSQCPL